MVGRTFLIISAICIFIIGTVAVMLAWMILAGELITIISAILAYVLAFVGLFLVYVGLMIFASACEGG